MFRFCLELEFRVWVNVGFRVSDLGLGLDVGLGLVLGIEVRD